MQRTFTFDQDYGTQVQDSTSKSTSEMTTAECVGLSCPTVFSHLAFGVGANLNWFPDCVIGLVPYLQYSGGGKIKTQQVTGNSGALITAPNPDTLLGYLRPYLAARAFNTPAVPLGEPSTWGGPSAGAWLLKQRSWVKTVGDLTYTMGVPRTKAVYDRCDNLVAVGASASVSAQVLKEFCIPELLFTVSSGIIWSVASFGTAAVASAAAGELASLFTTPVLGADFNCSNVSVLTATAWRTANVDASITVTDSVAGPPPP